MDDVPTTAYTSGPAGHIAYQVVGDGPVDLVLVPEWWNQVEAMWEEPLVSRVLHRLASFSRLICFDRRGIGLSDPLPMGASMDLDDWLVDLVTVMDAVGSERAAVVACSGGGPLGVRFAATRPERVSALVLVNAYARLERAPDHPIGAPAEVLEAGLVRIEQTWGTGELLDVLAPSLVEDLALRRWWARYQRQAMSPGSAVEIQRMLFGLDVRDALPQILAPTLVLHSTGDRFVRVDAGRHLAEHVADARFVELPGADHVFFGEGAEVMVDEVQAFVTGRRPAPSAERVLATMLFTDVVGSTDHAAGLGDRAWKQLLDRHDSVVRREVRRFRGTEVDRAGDGFFISFDRPGAAVDCALAVSRAVAELGIDLRAGLHTGEIELRRDGVSGLAVHVAARVAALGGAGDVLATGTVRDLVLGSSHRFTPRGRHTLKGIPDEWVVYAVDTA